MSYCNNKPLRNFLNGICTELIEVIGLISLLSDGNGG